jgi:hypothetical protein
MKVVKLAASMLAWLGVHKGLMSFILVFHPDLCHALATLEASFPRAYSGVIPARI